MEKQSCSNAEYSQRECVEIVGMPSSGHQKQLEDLVCKIFEELNCNMLKMISGIVTV